MAPSGLQVGSLRRRLAAAGINAILLVITAGRVHRRIPGGGTSSRRRTDRRAGALAAAPSESSPIRSPESPSSTTESSFGVLEVLDLGRRFGELVALDGVDLDGRRGRDRRPGRPQRRRQDHDDACGHGHPRARRGTITGAVTRSARPTGCASATCRRSAASTRRCACSTSSPTSPDSTASTRRAAPRAARALARAPRPRRARRREAGRALARQPAARAARRRARPRTRAARARRAVRRPRPRGGRLALASAARPGRRGAAVLFSSHQLELVERVCGRIVILDAGRVLAAGTLARAARALPGPAAREGRRAGRLGAAARGRAGRARGRGRRAARGRARHRPPGDPRGRAGRRAGRALRLRVRRAGRPLPPAALAMSAAATTGSSRAARSPSGCAAGACAS